MSKIRFETGQVVNFDGTPTPQDVEEVANQLGIKKSAELPTTPTTSTYGQGLLNAPGKVWEDYGAAGQKIGSSITGGAETIAQGIEKAKKGDLFGAFGKYATGLGQSVFGSIAGVGGAVFSPLMRSAEALVPKTGNEWVDTATQGAAMGAPIAGPMGAAGGAVINVGFKAVDEVQKKLLENPKFAEFNQKNPEILPLVNDALFTALMVGGEKKLGSKPGESPSITEVPLRQVPKMAAKNIFETAKVGVKVPIAATKGFINLGNQLAKFSTGQATGLNPETISRIISNPQDFSPEALKTYNREGIAGEAINGIQMRLNALSETGKEYQPIREASVPVTLPKNVFKNILDKYGIKVDKTGKLLFDKESIPTSGGDQSALQNWYSIYGKDTQHTSNSFLNARKALDNLIKWDSTGKTDAVDVLEMDFRRALNSERKQIPGLESIDNLFSAETNALKTVKKDYFNKDGTLKDNAISKIATLTGKGKENVLDRLESISPGIKERILTLKAVEDIQASGGQKVGTYGRALIPGVAGYAIGNIPGAIVGAILASPTMATKILRGWGKTLGVKDAAMQKIIQTYEASKTQATKEPQAGFARLPGKKKIVSSEAEPLVEEARKYKSAEEFVKAQTNAYHGTYADFTEFKKTTKAGVNNESTAQPIFLASDSKTAGNFALAKGGKVMDVAISPDAKIFDYKDVGKGAEFYDQAPMFQKIQSFLEKNGWTEEQAYNRTKKIAQGEWGAIEDKTFQKYLTENGYDGFHILEDGQKTTGIINLDKLKTKSQLTDIWNKTQGKATNLPTSKPSLATDIFKTGEQKSDLNLKRDVSVTTLTGEKVTIPEGEALSTYEKGGKALLKDGREYVVSKSQYENIKNNSLKSEAKDFAPELKGTEETVKGSITEKQKAIGEQNISTLKDMETKIREKASVYTSKGKDAPQNLIDELTTVVEKRRAIESGFTRGDTTKFSQYQLPGGKNYKEVLIKAPEGKLPEKYTKFEDYRQELIKKYGDNFYNSNYSSKLTLQEASKLRTLKRFSQQKNELYLPENKSKLKEAEESIRKQTFKSSHWDEPNVISHLRLNERTYKGKKVTFMEELQSDWAREGRANGFSGPEEVIPGKKFHVEKQGENNFVVKDENNVEWHSSQNRTVAEARAETFNQRGIPGVLKREGIPNHPLLKNWQELSIKRALKEAVDNNSEYLSWINGEQTSARYNLSTQLENAKWQPRPHNNAIKEITLKTKEGKDIRIDIDEKGIITNYDENWKYKKLDEVLGKGLADSIMSKESGTLSGEGLKFGGEWANNLYDKQVKNIVEDLTGAKVEVIDMGLPIDNKTKSFEIATHGKVATSFEKLTPQNAKVGQEVRIGDTTDGDYYIITDILGGDGKFKAMPKNEISENSIKLLQSGKDHFDLPLQESQRISNYAETFDISTKKSVGQQAIFLTPAIKAKIRGEAPLLKKPSAKLPNQI